MTTKNRDDIVVIGLKTATSTKFITPLAVHVTSRSKQDKSRKSCSAAVCGGPGLGLGEGSCLSKINPCVILEGPGKAAAAVTRRILVCALHAARRGVRIG